MSSGHPLSADRSETETLPPNKTAFWICSPQMRILPCRVTTFSTNSNHISPIEQILDYINNILVIFNSDIDFDITFNIFINSDNQFSNL